MVVITRKAFQTVLKRILDLYHANRRLLHRRTTSFLPCFFLAIVVGVAAGGKKSNKKYLQSGGGEAVMVQTTAAVHSGASGGALVSPRDGRFLGLITSNARHGGDCHRLSPEVNFFCFFPFLR